MRVSIKFLTKSLQEKTDQKFVVFVHGFDQPLPISTELGEALMEDQCESGRFMDLDATADQHGNPIINGIWKEADA